MGLIVGRYTGTWNTLAMGQTKEGFRTQHQILKKPVMGDAAAQARQDAVYQGMNLEISCVLLEYDGAAIATIMWPNGGTKWTLGTVGLLDASGASPLAKQMIFTRASASTTAVPATLTFPLTALKEGFPVDLLYYPDVREVPLLLVAYPNGSGQYATET